MVFVGVKEGFGEVIFGQASGQSVFGEQASETVWQQGGNRKKSMMRYPSTCRIIATLRAYHTQSHLTPLLLFVVTGEERTDRFFCNHHAAHFGIMTKIARLFIVLLFAGLIAGVVFLTTWNIPAPSAQVEKMIPNDKFPH